VRRGAQIDLRAILSQIRGLCGSSAPQRSRSAATGAGSASCGSRSAARQPCSAAPELDWRDPEPDQHLVTWLCNTTTFIGNIWISLRASRIEFRVSWIQVGAVWNSSEPLRTNSQRFDLDLRLTDQDPRLANPDPRPAELGPSPADLAHDPLISLAKTANKIRMLRSKVCVSTTSVGEPRRQVGDSLISLGAPPSRCTRCGAKSGRLGCRSGSCLLYAGDTAGVNGGCPELGQPPQNKRNFLRNSSRHRGWASVCSQEILQRIS
jgi:hypothetical protein